MFVNNNSFLTFVAVFNPLLYEHPFATCTTFTLYGVASSLLPLGASLLFPRESGGYAAIHFPVVGSKIPARRRAREPRDTHICLVGFWDCCCGVTALFHWPYLFAYCSFPGRTEHALHGHAASCEYAARFLHEEYRRADAQDHR